MLKAGPHAVIRAFEVEPAYRDKTFVGFRIVRINPHPVFGVASQIKIGDILVSANGVRIETPSQFMGAWQKLKTVKSVTIRLCETVNQNSLLGRLTDDSAYLVGGATDCIASFSCPAPTSLAQLEIQSLRLLQG